MSLLQQLGDVLSHSAARAAGNVSVRIKTNLGPAITFNNLTAPGPSVLDSLGLKYAVTILDAQGRSLVSSGDEPTTSPLLVTAYGSILLGLTFVFYRGVRSFF